MNTQTHKIEWTRVNNDINGNPRYVCHFFNLLTEAEKYADYATRGTGIDAAVNSLDNQYKLAIKRAKAIGGRKFHNKQYGGGIIFQSYNLKETESQINELLNK